MLSKNVIVLQKKENADEIQRGYLLYVKGNPTPFVVCSYYHDDNDGTCGWDWGHYHDNMLSALITFYKDEIEEHFNLKNNLKTILDIPTNELTNEEQNAMCEVIDFINRLLNDTMQGIIK
jgi:hypothetical protein